MSAHLPQLDGGGRRRRRFRRRRRRRHVTDARYKPSGGGCGDGETVVRAAFGELPRLGSTTDTVQSIIAKQNKFKNILVNFLFVLGDVVEFF